ncbi:hypothetical protein JOF56_011050 [Kibdelosporangium banguiense]|uniref:Uncharacterized protein n=1 Tax=Kibdelosporangium banguiense TaxID=1365924 RepID=A0ABS4U3B9_9PSEU|nr:hypothetical protein [Kibdelosporangium banguiense]MBP2330665.1 hypothetical protein [Kibdelosporangium banguiense]
MRHWAVDIDDPTVRARNRAASARLRAQQLQQRRAMLAVGGDLTNSPQETLQAAAEALTEARRRADDARKSAKEGYLRAIDAHERAAARHDLAAEMGIGDVHDHRRRAAKHRDEAMADRTTLAAEFD